MDTSFWLENSRGLCSGLSNLENSDDDDKDNIASSHCTAFHFAFSSSKDEPRRFSRYLPLVSLLTPVASTPTSVTHRDSFRRAHQPPPVAGPMTTSQFSFYWTPLWSLTLWAALTASGLAPRRCPVLGKGAQPCGPSVARLRL